MNKHWLCRKCSGTEKHFHLASFHTPCDVCGEQAFSIYEKSNGKWEPYVISKNPE